jgi:hypothetical protein
MPTLPTSEHRTRASWRARRRLLALVVLALAACAGPRAASKGESAMNDDLFEVRNITVSIHRPPADVYAFVTNGENIPRWAAGLGKEIRRADGGEWVAEGPLGSVKVRFAEPNALGVADHDVTLSTGATVHNPIRVLPNAAGSSVIFTLMRLPGVSAQRFEEDAKAVDRDLKTLRELLERK